MWKIGQSFNRQNAKWQLKWLTSVCVQWSKQLHHVPKLVWIGKPIPVQHIRALAPFSSSHFVLNVDTQSCSISIARTKAQASGHTTAFGLVSSGVILRDKYLRPDPVKQYHAPVCCFCAPDKQALGSTGCRMPIVQPTQRAGLLVQDRARTSCRSAERHQQVLQRAAGICFRFPARGRNRRSLTKAPRDGKGPHKEASAAQLRGSQAETAI